MATSVIVELQEGVNSITFMRGSGSEPGFYELDYIALSPLAEEPEEPAVQPKTSLTGAQRLESGQTLDLTMSISDVTDSLYQSVFAQDVTVSFNPAKLSFKGASSLKEGLKLLEPKEAEPDKIRILAFAEGTGIKPEGEWLKLSFTALTVNETSSVTVELGAVALANGEGEKLELAGTSHEAQMTKPSSSSGDVNGDELVTVGDLAIVAAAYGKTSSDPDWAQFRKADLNQDGKVDIEDLAKLAKLIIG